MKTLIKTASLFALVIAVGCASGNRGDGSGSIAAGGGGPQDNTGEVSLTTFAGEYELVVNHDTEELYVYTLPDRDNSYGPIAYGFSTPKEAFRLEKPDYVYVLTSAAMSYGDLLEVSLAAETVEPIEHCVNLIDRSYEGAWIAYNKMHDLSHDLNPGENWGACSMYIDHDGEGEPVHLANPPLGSYVYMQYPGEVKPLFTVTASSTLTETGKPADYFGPGKLIDGDRSTAWVEGVGGLGVGEWVELTANAPISIHGIRVWGGFAESEATMTGNSYPIKMSVILDGDNEAGYVVFPPPSKTPHSDYLGKWFNDNASVTTVRAETIRLTIEEVKPGTKWEDCCISEIEVW